MPGARALGTIRDGAGRPAAAIALPPDMNDGKDIVAFDPKTSRLLAEGMSDGSGGVRWHMIYGATTRGGRRASAIGDERTYVRVCSRSMEPAVHRITILAPQPPTVWQRLETVLADGGSPPITMTRSATTLTFTCDTGDFMLRARVADALMTVCDHGEWRRCFAPED